MVIKVIYLDLLFLLNFIYDFLLLITTGLVLKRVVKLKKILIAAITGACSYFLFFLNISNFVVWFYIIGVGIIMIIIAYGKKNIFTNLVYFYMNCIILAGFFYFLKVQLSYERTGLLYKLNINNTNTFLIMIISPIILYLYVKQNKLLKEKQNLNYLVNVYLKNGEILNLNGFIDSGNRLRCPVTKKYIIILANGVYDGDNPMYVPFTGVNKTGLLKCFSIKFIEINKQKFKNYLIGISDGDINIEGSDCILNGKLMEDLNV